MQEKLKTTQPFESHSQVITSTNFQNEGSYSYQKYLEEQEKRHTEQIEKIYKQNAEYNCKLSLQISQL